MIRSVIVGQPDPATQPALEEPPSEKSEAIREKLTGLNETVRTHSTMILSMTTGRLMATATTITIIEERPETGRNY